MTKLINLFYKILDIIGITNIVYYDGKKPYRKHDGDAGYDLYVLKDVVIPAYGYCDIPVNTILTSRRMWFLLTGRSSSFRTKGLIIMDGIIDNGYTDYINTLVYNPSSNVKSVKAGERICQVIPFKLTRTRLIGGVVNKPNSRGKEGFGSTGM